MEKKKVYFSASITGGTDPWLYRGIIERLKQRFIVLTEHFGVDNISEYEDSHGHTEEYIYNRDIAWLDECDFMFAELTKISTGVGYEIGYLEAKGKNIYCVADKDKVEKLTAMVTGNKNLNFYFYHNIDELNEYIDALPE